MAAGGKRIVEPREIVLEQGREVLYKGQPCWLIKVQGYDTPEEVAGLRGFYLVVPDSDRPTLDDEDEYYVNDLIGLDIVLKDTGETVGVLDDVFLNTGGGWGQCFVPVCLWMLLCGYPTTPNLPFITSMYYNYSRGSRSAICEKIGWVWYFFSSIRWPDRPSC